MQTRSITIAMTLAVFCLALAAPSFAGDRRGKRKGLEGPPRVERLLDQIDASDETRAAVETLVEESRAEGERLRAAVDQARRELREALHADDVDREAVLAQAEELGELESDARIHRLDTMLRVRAELSPEQRASLETMRQAHHAELTEACSEDMATLCPDADPSGGRRSSAA